MMSTILIGDAPVHRLELFANQAGCVRNAPSIIQGGRTSVEARMDLLPKGVEFRGNEVGGITLRVSRGVKCGPLRHVLVSDWNLSDHSSICLERDSSAVLFVEHKSVSDNPDCSENVAQREGVTEIIIEEGSRLILLEMQEPSAGLIQKVKIHASLGRNARLDHAVAGSSNGSSELNCLFEINGENGVVEQRRAGLFYGKGLHRSNTKVVHNAEHGRSRIIARSCTIESAEAVSCSAVSIQPSANKTDSNVSDHCIIASPDSQCQSTPLMEILADDVTAGHSASTTHFDPEHIFYMAARGMNETSARQTIITGFLSSAFDSVFDGLNLCPDLQGFLSQSFENIHADPLKNGINRADFPILLQKVNGKPLTYLDSAATSQKPDQVIKTVERFYKEDNANIHRGMYALSERASRKYEEARKKVARFINARPNEIVFVRNATEGINLIANSLGRKILKPTDRILLTEMEHHANIVPWQLISLETKSTIDVVRVTGEGLLDQESLRRGLAQKPKIVSVTHVSNVLGTVNPVKEITLRSHEAGAFVIIDAAQSVPHMSVDVKDIGCDALVFSGHKMLGPTGIGVIYIRNGLMDWLPPFMGGGGMIKEVAFDKVSFKSGPERFEAGTPNIAGAIGLGAAVDYLETIGMGRVNNHNNKLMEYAMKELSMIPQVRIYGPKDPLLRCGSIAFNLGDVHAHDVSTVLDEEGVAIRAGHHCAMPLMENLKVVSTCRASFQFYNSTEDIDRLVAGIKKSIGVFGL